jgi:hypothetical protein
MDYTSGGDHNTAGLSQFRQQRPPQEAISGRISHTESAPLQNQYQFVPGQYPPPVLDNTFIPISGRQILPQLTQAGPSRVLDSEYSASVRTHQQQSPGSLHGAVDYNPVPQQPMNSDLYYYPPDLVSGDQSSQPYSFGTSHQQPQYQSPVDPAMSFTPNSDLHTLPPNTSVSPPWTEERLPQGYGTGPSAAGPSKVTPSPQRPRLAGQPAGKRDRGMAKKLVGRKRQRRGVEGDSESESDEDASEAVQMPSRGPENLPTRL